ncbi:MAG: hypothetical protein ABSG55_00815 [Dehalococcoidia bacterium]|jgi:hypothetical protein
MAKGQQNMHLITMAPGCLANVIDDIKTIGAVPRVGAVRVDYRQLDAKTKFEIEEHQHLLVDGRSFEARHGLPERERQQVIGNATNALPHAGDYGSTGGVITGAPPPPGKVLN